MEGFFWLGIFILVLVFASKIEKNEELTNQQNSQDFDGKLICPHCHTKGTVTTEKIKQKQGIHGGKATAAVLTAGISLFGTGLSKKNKITKAHCSNCGQTWTY